MKNLVKKQTEETKALNPEAGILYAIIENNGKKTGTTISISANAKDVAIIIDDILRRYPKIQEELVEIAITNTLYSKINHFGKDDATEEFNEVG